MLLARTLSLIDEEDYQTRGFPYLLFRWSTGLGLSVPFSQDQSSCRLANCLVMGWELLSEQGHFQLPGLFGLEHPAPALSLAQGGECR